MTSTIHGSLPNVPEEDPLLTFRHVRTASVILPSGDRVRRKVSLLSIQDESPFEDEDTPLLGDGSANIAEGYSSIHSGASGRDLPPWHVSRFKKVMNYLKNEPVKRYRRSKTY